MGTGQSDQAANLTFRDPEHPVLSHKERGVVSEWSGMIIRSNSSLMIQFICQTARYRISSQQQSAGSPMN